jgi:hypothetical protein
MVLTYFGGGFIKAQFGDMTLAFNPISKDSKLKTSRFGADIALVSINHPDCNGADQLEFGDKKPFLVGGPGEYEVKGVFIKGFKSKSAYDGKERINTIYTLGLDGMNICFLGALGNMQGGGDIDSETLEAIDDIDILFVPIGGSGVLDAATANKIAVKLEPRLIIPIHYNDDDKVALKTFLKDAGVEKIQPVDKLTIKKKDLDGKEGDVVVLSATN